MKNKEKVVLAYSGGLDTSVILKWLIETYDLDVIAVCIDLGQNEDLSGVKQKARKTYSLIFWLKLIQRKAHSIRRISRHL